MIKRMPVILKKRLVHDELVIWLFDVACLKIIWATTYIVNDQ